MFMMMILLTMFTMMFIFMSHPMSMGLIMLMQVFIVSLITSLLNSNSWFSYILFLIMIGGMLVLFIYMTSIASNEKFKYSNKLFIVLMPMGTLMIFMLFDKFLLNYQNFSNNLNNIMNLSLNKYYFFPNYIILLMLITYLFFSLIAVVKISEINHGPLRQKY